MNLSGDVDQSIFSKTEASFAKLSVSPVNRQIPLSKILGYSENYSYKLPVVSELGPSRPSYRRWRRITNNSDVNSVTSQLIIKCFFVAGGIAGVTD